MTVSRIACAIALAGVGLATSPASAQFYLQSHDFSGARVAGDEADLGQALPGATPAEVKAALNWRMRAALNVAALQCQFEPTLLTRTNYNAIIADHAAELKASFDTLSNYFMRTGKTKKDGQNGLDQFNTRTYSSYSTTAAQYGFCQTAGSIGREMLFTPRGGFSTVTEQRMRQLRNSLIPYGEQQFPGYIGMDRSASVPRLDAICWNRKGEWVDKKCGLQNWPPAGAGVASR